MKRGCYQGDRHGNCDVGDFHLEEDQSPQRHPLRRHDRGSSSFALLDMIEDVVSSYKAPIFLGPASPQQVDEDKLGLSFVIPRMGNFDPLASFDKKNYDPDREVRRFANLVFAPALAALGAEAFNFVGSTTRKS
ncbi:hypothetical protein YC2023_120910 [Brassica napus]